MSFADGTHLRINGRAGTFVCRQATMDWFDNARIFQRPMKLVPTDSLFCIWTVDSVDYNREQVWTVHFSKNE